MGRRIISYSLYGHEPRYLLGALRNAIAVPEFYPGWTARFYVSCATMEHCPWVIAQMELAGAEVLSMGHDTDIPPMFWRFLVADERDVERFIVRDADSRLSLREVAAVNQWIAEDTVLHVMRDHPAHQCVPGGLWGGMWQRDNWEAPRMHFLIDDFLGRCRRDPNAYQADQDFLITHIWGWAQQSVTVHDSNPVRRGMLGGKRFPYPREEWPRFCGEVMLIGENGEDVPRVGDFEQIPKDDE